MRLLPLLLLVACGSDIAITKESRCDGVLQGDEDKVDLPFDADGDGFFDANNPDCAETYPADRLDCDDGDATVNPEAAEIACDGIDNDCADDTLDAADADGDGFDACADCDDDDAAINPDMAEIGCNDVDDDCDPETADAADADGDGWNACQDCDDDVAAINPGAVEVQCNGLDDDCDETTVDDEDNDGDGRSVCDDDCDDDDPDRYPGNDEVCEDELDNDCDGDVDEDCTVDYTGTWALDQTITYTCAIGSVTIHFDEVFLQDNNPTLSVSSTGTGSQPGTMQGTFTTDADFETERVLTGTCNEIYDFSGSFLDDTHFNATFTATFTGSFCLDCSVQSWLVSGSR